MDTQTHSMQVQLVSLCPFLVQTGNNMYIINKKKLCNPETL